MKERKVKFFLAGAFLSALGATAITPLLSLGVAGAATVDVTASLMGGFFAVSKA